MAPGALFCTTVFAMALLSQPVESCFPRSIQATVPALLTPDHSIAQVHLGGCRRAGLRLISGDQDFAVRSDGTIYVTRATRLMQQRSFWVWVRDGGGQPSGIRVRLTPDAQQESVPVQLAGAKAPWDVARKRAKRRWSPPPFNIMENELPPFPKEVEQVGSDSSVNYTVYYTITGPGVDKPPEELFSVDRNSGMVYVHRAVDREQFSQITFFAKVFDRKTGIETDRPLDITVLVGDVNDNAPTFSGPLEFHVAEECRPGTEVGVVMAADKDQEETLHTKIRFSLLTGAQLFSIDPHSGMISALSGSLDRETQESIPLTVEIRDMDGASNGLSNTTTATIVLVDINDNPPTFSATSYEANVEENTADVLLLRIPVSDKDEKGSKNWITRFKITQGNENGYFRVDTDPNTNEGLLYLIKPLNYEKGAELTLTVRAENEAPLVGGAYSSVPVKLRVGDVDEGPEFQPPHLVLRVKEGLPNGTVLGMYTAQDPETGSSTGMRYQKLTDPASWVSVNESSGELKVSGHITLLSPLVTNASYRLSVMALDPSEKSGVGMVTLIIEDINDHVPMVVPGPDVVMCEEEEGRSSVTIRAEDADGSPYAEPFHFQLGEGHAGKWRIRDATNTSAVLEQVVDMPRGVYQVPVLITDLQNQGQVQELSVRVCHCVGGQCVSKQTSVSLGAWGVLAMLLGLALLLLLCIFVVFFCTTKGDKIYLDDSSGGMLLKSNTEAPGEEVKSANLFLIPSAVDVTGSSPKGATGSWEHKVSDQVDTSLIGQQTMDQQNVYQATNQEFLSSQGHSAFYSSGTYGGGLYSDSTFYRQSNRDAHHTWATNGLYLEQKLQYFLGDAEERYADDLLCVHRYEGDGSPAGSVGCCSELGDQDNLDFLDSLGSKFKTLANICMEQEEEQ